MATGTIPYNQKVNPNLLDNGYLVGGGSQQGDGYYPINQRRKSQYTSAGMTVDRWSNTRNNTVDVLSAGVKLTFGTAQGYQQLVQTVPVRVSELIGKKLTFSAIVETTKDIYLRVIYDSGSTDHFTQAIEAGTDGLTSLTFTVPNGATLLSVCVTSLTNVYNDGYFILKAAKLEVGDAQTLAHYENGAWIINDIPNFEEERARCQRYFVCYYYSNSEQYNLCLGYAYDATTAYFLINLPVQMETGMATFVGDLPRVYSVPASTNRNATSVDAITICGNIATIKMTASGMTAGEMLRVLLMQNQMFGISIGE